MYNVAKQKGNKMSMRTIDLDKETWIWNNYEPQLKKWTLCQSAVNVDFPTEAILLKDGREYEVHLIKLTFSKGKFQYEAIYKMGPLV